MTMNGMYIQTHWKIKNKFKIDKDTKSMAWPNTPWAHLHGINEHLAL